MLVQNRYFNLMDLFTLVKGLCNDCGVAGETKKDGEEHLRITRGDSKYAVVMNCIGGKEFLLYLVRDYVYPCLKWLRRGFLLSLSPHPIPPRLLPAPPPSTTTTGLCGRLERLPRPQTEHHRIHQRARHLA